MLQHTSSEVTDNTKFRFKYTVFNYTVLANIFMCHFEEKWVFNSKGRPSIWFRYVDHTFTLFDSKSNALQFLQYLNSCHVNIKFTIEFEENNVIPFLDVLIKRHNHIFSTSISQENFHWSLH